MVLNRNKEVNRLPIWGQGHLIRSQLGKWVKSWEQRNQKDKAARDQKIELIASSLQERYLASLELNRMRLDNIFEHVLACLLLLLSLTTKSEVPVLSTAVMLVGIAAIGQGFTSTVQYWREVMVFTEAKNKAFLDRQI